MLDRDLGVRLEHERRGRTAGGDACLHHLPAGGKVRDDPRQQLLLCARFNGIDPGEHDIAADVAFLGACLLSADERFGEDLLRGGFTLRAPHLLAHDADCVHRHLIGGRAGRVEAGHRIILDTRRELRIGQASSRRRRLLGRLGIALVSLNARLVRRDERECVLQPQPGLCGWGLLSASGTGQRERRRRSDQFQMLHEHAFRQARCAR